MSFCFVFLKIYRFVVPNKSIHVSRQGFLRYFDKCVARIFVCNTLYFVRGHSTTTWTRRGGGGGGQQKVHACPPRGGGGLSMSTWTKIWKNSTEQLWQSTMKSLITSTFVQLWLENAVHIPWLKTKVCVFLCAKSLK